MILRGNGLGGRRFTLETSYGLVVLAGLVFCVLAYGNEDWPQAWVSNVLVAALVVYLSVEVSRELRSKGYIALLSPPVLASGLHFLLSYALPILAVPLNDEILRKTSEYTHARDPFPWINTTLVLSLGGAIAMWLGYRNVVAIKLAQRVKRRLGRAGWVRPVIKPKLLVVLMFTALGIGATLLQVRLGVYGYASDYEALFAEAAWRGVLGYASDLLNLSVFVVAFVVFDREVARRRSLGLCGLLSTILVTQIFAGFLSGFKGQVIMPVVIVGVARFLVRRRIPWGWIGAGVALVIAAFAVVEPFRVLRFEDRGFDSTSVTSILQTLISATEGERTAEQNTAIRILWRSELVSVTSAAIWHEENLEGFDPYAANFGAAIALSPLLAVVPRMLWPSKPIYQFGRWFAEEVLHGPRHLNNAVGMGPISYFYFAGGWPGVLLGFFCIGVMMRVVYSTFTPLGAGGWLVYFSVAAPFGIIYSEVGPALTGILQTLPLALIAQMLVLRKSKLVA